MDAKSFYDEFISRVKEDNLVEAEMIPSFPEFVGKSFDWIYREKQAAYTELVNKHIVSGIINEAYPTDDPRHLVSQHEYFRIDTIGYQHRYMEMPAEEAETLGLNRHFWDLKIAVEHENSKADWMDEVIKLTHIRCPLKVIIAYNYFDERPEGDIEKLNYVARWMTRVSAYDVNAEEEFLAIIGNGASRKNKALKYDRFGYKGYLFDKNSELFAEL